MQNLAENSRMYKLKNPAQKIFCPLCRTPRELLYTSKLKPVHYLQIILTSIFLGWALHPLMEEKVFILPFIVWGMVEMGRKVFFRKEIPCPHCGFDATWYKKDVRVARRLVEKYWEQNKSAGPVDGPAEEEEAQEGAPSAVLNEEMRPENKIHHASEI